MLLSLFEVSKHLRNINNLIKMIKLMYFKNWGKVLRGE